MSPASKQLWLLAGGNGAGKSTFYHTRLEPLGMPFINADLIARQLFPDQPEQRSYDAAVVATEMRNRLLLEGRSFCFETVFSHPSKIDFVAHAKALGYEIVLVFIHLGLEQLNQSRVAQRVASGGHHVPEHKVKKRIPALLKNIQTVIPLCDQVRVLDNASNDNPFLPVLTIRTGSVELLMEPLPEWVGEIIGG